MQDSELNQLIIDLWHNVRFLFSEVQYLRNEIHKMKAAELEKANFIHPVDMTEVAWYNFGSPDEWSKRSFRRQNGRVQEDE